MRMNTDLAKKILEQNAVAIPVAVEDCVCFMVREQEALDAISAALEAALPHLGAPEAENSVSVDLKAEAKRLLRQARNAWLCDPGTSGTMPDEEIIVGVIASALAARQPVGEAVLYQIRDHLDPEVAAMWDGTDRAEKWAKIPKEHYDAYVSVMGGCGPKGIIGNPSEPETLELNRFAQAKEVRALYAAPPAQQPAQVDLGQFRGLGQLRDLLVKINDDEDGEYVNLSAQAIDLIDSLGAK